jgi:hypothetical protein
MASACALRDTEKAVKMPRQAMAVDSRVVGGGDG